MWDLLVQRISNKPPIRHIHIDFFQSSAQGTNAVDMLNQHNFKQHNGIDAGTTIVLAVQIADKLIYLMKVDCCVDLPQQMILGYHLLQTHKLDLISVFDIFRKHVYHPNLLYHIFASFTRKRSPVGDLFLPYGKSGNILVTLTPK